MEGIKKKLFRKGIISLIAMGMMLMINGMIPNFGIQKVYAATYTVDTVNGEKHDDGIYEGTGYCAYGPYSVAEKSRGWKWTGIESLTDEQKRDYLIFKYTYHVDSKITSTDAAKVSASATNSESNFAVITNVYLPYTYDADTDIVSNISNSLKFPEYVY